MTHPITPPPELVKTWVSTLEFSSDEEVFGMIARWGADQQLAKDAEWLDQHALDAPHLKITPVGESLKEAMRPKPPSLKELALDELTSAERLYPADWSTIRRALEALPND